LQLSPAGQKALAGTKTFQMEYLTSVHQASSAIRLEFIDENGGGPGVRLRKRLPKKS
jgi:hypothetical protein